MILPSPSQETGVYWQAAQEGRLLLKHCASCDNWFHPRQSQCCQESNLAWRQASGLGILLSYTIVRYQLNPALAGQLPYTITLTRTSEGPQLLTALPGDNISLTIGQPMVITFDRITDDVSLPRFTPAQQAENP